MLSGGVQPGFSPTAFLGIPRAPLIQRMSPAVYQGVQPSPSPPSDESSLKMNHVEHIPQSMASHSGSYLWEAQWDEHGADMLKSDPRDTFFLSKWMGLSTAP